LDWELSKRTPRLPDRSKRGSFGSTDPGLHLLLSRGSNPRFARERHTGAATRFFQAEPICTCGFIPTHGWLTSSIRLATGCLKRSFDCGWKYVARGMRAIVLKASGDFLLTCGPEPTGISEQHGLAAKKIRIPTQIEFCRRTPILAEIFRPTPPIIDNGSTQ
jgi:hypothetical protein